VHHFGSTLAIFSVPEFVSSKTAGWVIPYKKQKIMRKNLGKYEKTLLFMKIIYIGGGFNGNLIYKWAIVHCHV